MKSEYLNNKTFESIIERFQRSKRHKIKYTLIIDDIKRSIDVKSNKNKNIEQEVILLKDNELKRYQAQEDFSESEQLLAQAFYVLAENLVRFAKFNLIDADDALQEGVFICLEKIDRFNPEKGKAFNYMTTCILNHFRQLYRSARNYNELKKRYFEFINSCKNKIIIKNGKELFFYQ